MEGPITAKTRLAGDDKCYNDLTVVQNTNFSYIVHPCLGAVAFPGTLRKFFSIFGTVKNTDNIYSCTKCVGCV